MKDGILFLLLGVHLTFAVYCRCEPSQGPGSGYGSTAGPCYMRSGARACQGVVVVIVIHLPHGRLILPGGV